MQSNNISYFNARSKRLLLATLGLIWVVRLLMLAQIPLIDNSESRYAEMARKMAATGDWVTPRYIGNQPFWAKPPLSMWLSGAGIKLFGENEFGARIFIFLASCAILLLLYSWIKGIKGKDTALAATFILATSSAFVITSGTVMTDLPLCASTTLAMVAYWHAIHRKSKWWGMVFFIALGLGMLAKGPIALVLTALPIGIWLIGSRRLIEGIKCLPWISGVLLALAIALPWYVLAEIRTPGFLNYFIIGEHWDRFLIKGWNGDLYGNAHSEPPGTIWYFGLISLLPWTLIMPYLIFKIPRVFQNIQSEEKPYLGYLSAWLVSPLLFFTAARNIIPTYALTGIPAGAILFFELTALTNDKTTNRIVIRYLKWGAAASTILITSTWLLFSYFPDRMHKQSQREMVKYIESRSDLKEIPLSYRGKPLCSAWFYRKGQVNFIDDEGIKKLFCNHHPDLLVVPARTDSAQPPLIHDHFTQIATIGRFSLMRENVNQNSDLVAAEKGNP
ncbi:glycosyltransferase family 39 protein [Luteolibacter pohnpeiensis]|uniref:Glycosyltransferase family 39 protein n=1 Tax=Luteolibacter pohnpeiensis TaxID=454153 RepID=A0A934S8J5_9BACT|nr:glycosyltransferase family 39 protein [Luteolibacter pohnpeiensis]MBK1883214.1 glycosyltransferase family 39 protein [Luteolibacter pohnpeiensis]